MHTFSEEAKAIVLKNLIDEVARLALGTFTELGLKKEISGSCENEAGERFVFSFAKVVDTPPADPANQVITQAAERVQEAEDFYKAIAAGWIWEDTLPRIDQGLYDAWHAKSRVIFGVRMGPKLADIAEL